MARGRKAAVKDTEEKKVDKITEVPAKVVEEVKDAVENAKAVVEEVIAEVKPEAEKEAKVEEEKKTPAKRGRKPAAEKTEAEEKKAPVKRGRKPVAEEAAAPKEAVANIVLQFDFGEYVSEEIVEKCKQAYKAENKAKIKTIDVYVKPADKKAYYVVNDKSAGSVDL